MAKTVKLDAYALDDNITRIFLIERGNLEPKTDILYRSSNTEIAAYVTYLLSTLNLMNIRTRNTGREDKKDAKLEKLFVKVHEYISDESTKLGMTNLNEVEFLDMFTKIKNAISNGTDVEIPEKYIEFLGECSQFNPDLDINWKKFKGSEVYTKIPTMNCVYTRNNDELELKLEEEEHKELKGILEKMRSDSYFSKDYRIKRVFKPETPPHVIPEEMKKTWKKQTVLHGTSNFAILGILNSNFNLSRVSAGRALGDGVYFARTDQSSKPLFYLDNKVKGSRYMFICDIYYKYYKEVHGFNSNLKYNGKNMVWGKDLGQYQRDELVVLPSQIEVRYVVECSPR